MLNIILKDLKIVRKNLIVAVIFGITWSFAGLVAEDLFVSVTFSSAAILFLIFFSVISIINYDEKANADIVLNSFSIKRHEVVLAKYLSTLIITVLSCIFIYLLTNAIHLIPIPQMLDGHPVNLILVTVIIDISLIYHSFYLPLNYYSIGKAKSLNTIIYFILILLPSIAKKALGKIVDTNLFNRIVAINFSVVALGLLILSLTLYFLSFKISSQIYFKKEF